MTQLNFDGGYDLGANQRNFYFSGQSNDPSNDALTDVIIGNSCNYTPQAKLDVLEQNSNSGFITGSTGIYVENDDLPNETTHPSTYPVIGIKSFILQHNIIQNEYCDNPTIGGWFEADGEFDCTINAYNYAIFVPDVNPNTFDPAGGVSIGFNYNNNNLFVSAYSYPILLAVNGGILAAGPHYYPSDSILKKQVNSLFHGLDVIRKIQPISYKYNGKAEIDTNGTHYGLLAQQLFRAAPFAIDSLPMKLNPQVNTYSTIYSVDQMTVMYIAIEAIKQIDSILTLKDSVITHDSTQIVKQQQTNDSLRTEVNNLSNANSNLLNRHDSLLNAFANMQSCLNQLCPGNQRVGSAGPGGGKKDSSNMVANTMQDVALSNPSAPILYQNQPNPYGEGGTKINYFLPPGIASATMVFYDTYGNQLKTVTLSQAGAGTLNINPQNLASGIYTYSMIVNGQVVDTKRMIFTK